MHSRRILPVAALMLTAAAIFYAADNPKLPPPYATPSARNNAHVIPEPAGAKLNVPPGFKMEIWEEAGFQRARYMILGPSNEVILADAARRPQGTVYVLHNKERKKIIEGLYQPYGLAYLNGNLYVGESDSGKRYPYDSKTMTAGKGEELISMQGVDTH